MITLESSQTHTSNQIPPVFFLCMNEWLYQHSQCYYVFLLHAAKSISKWDNCQLGNLRGPYHSWAVDSLFPPVCWAMEVKIPIFTASLPMGSFKFAMVFMSIQWRDRGKERKKGRDFHVDSKGNWVKKLKDWRLLPVKTTWGLTSTPYDT